jgi:O-acetylserine/cysteine efflux transporter
VRLRHVALAVLVMVIWGLNFVVIDVGLDSFPPLLFATLRFVVVVIPAVFFVGAPCVPWRWVVSIGLTLTAGQFGLLFTSMHLGMPAGLSSLALQAQAAFTLVFAILLLGEAVQRRQVVGLGLAFAGIVLVATDLGQTAPLGAFALCLGAAAMWGLGNVLMRRARPPDVLNVMVWAAAVALVPLLVLSLLIEGPHTAAKALADLTPTGVGALAYIAYLATLFGYQVWGTLLRHYRASVVAPYSLLVPVVGMSSAALLLDERFGVAKLVAAALIVAGVTLNSVRPPRSGRDDPQSDQPSAPAAAEAPG